MALDRNRLLKPVKKLKKLIDGMSRQPAPDSVHDFRNYTRRFEAIFEALSLDSQGIRKSTLRSLGRLRKRAGKVRDMDVFTSYASTLQPRVEDESLVQLLEHLGSRRRRYAKKLYLEIQRLQPTVRKDLKRAPAVLARLIREKGDVPGESAMAANATATAVKLAAQLAVPRRLDRENLHPYRLKVKMLRNVLQMAAGDAHSRFVDELGEVKNAIGEWHDWKELVRIAQKALDHEKRRGLIVELKRIATRKYDHALALAERFRNRYLRNAPRPKKGASGASSKIPAEPVWQAAAMLAR